MLDQTFESVQDVFLFYKSHFAVDLSKLGLTVGTQVFIAEAFHQLIIPVVTRHHQQLFKGLGRLGQGIKLAFVHPGRNHKIAGAFWSRFDEIRSFYFDELLTIEVFSRFERQPVAQH